MSDLADFASRAEHSDWFERAIRLGFVAYGTVYVVLALLSLGIATGDQKGSASSSGAVHEIAQQPLGRTLLWVIALGLLALVVWRLFDAVEEQRYGDGAKAWGKSAVSLLKAVFYGAIAVTAVATASGSGGGGSSGGGTDSTTATILDLPAGRFLVGLVALAIIGYGLFLGWFAWTEKFRKNLSAEGKSGEAGRAYLLLGKIGYVAKGVVAVFVGGLFLYAALTHDAKKSGGVDVALHTLVRQPFGPLMVAAVAVGLACYGLFCFARARHLST